MAGAAMHGRGRCRDGGAENDCGGQRDCRPARHFGISGLSCRGLAPNRLATAALSCLGKTWGWGRMTPSASGWVVRHETHQIPASERIRIERQRNPGLCREASPGFRFTQSGLRASLKPLSAIAGGDGATRITGGDGAPRIIGRRIGMAGAAMHGRGRCRRQRCRERLRRPARLLSCSTFSYLRVELSRLDAQAGWRPRPRQDMGMESDDAQRVRMGRARRNPSNSRERDVDFARAQSALPRLLDAPRRRCIASNGRR